MTHFDPISVNLVTSDGERVRFEWDPGTRLPVTVESFDPAGTREQKCNLPREEARAFWADLLADGFTIYDR